MGMIQILDLDTAVRLAEEIVTERGRDFRYNPSGKGLCMYVPLSDDRAPSVYDTAGASRYAEGAAITGCLVGSIIERAGLMTDEIARAAKFIRTVIGDGMLDATPEASDFLTNLQDKQDKGAAWGYALDNAKAAAR